MCMRACVRNATQKSVHAHTSKRARFETQHHPFTTRRLSDCHIVYQLYRTSPSRYPGANLLKDAAVVLQRTLPNGWRCYGANSNGVCVDSVRAVMDSEVHGERMQRCFSARVTSNATTSSSEAHVSRERKKQATAPERSPTDCFVPRF